MRLFSAVVGVILFLGGFFSAAATPLDNITTFDAAGIFRDGATLSGTVSIDLTAGRVVGVDLTVSGAKPTHFDTVGVQRSYGYAYVVHVFQSKGVCPELIFGERNSPDSVRGYMGGPLGPNTVIVNCNDRADLLSRGILTWKSGPKKPASYI